VSISSWLGSPDLNLTYRQRIRTLVGLSFLTDAHTLDELQDPNSAAHRELVSLIAGLVTRKDSSSPRT
jgi:hypothetical protein